MRRVLALLLVVCSIFIITACTGNAPAQTSAAASQTSAASASAVTSETKTDAVSDELYIEVSAANNLDYFYDHKIGLKMAGEAMGVKTEYVGPAEYNMDEMVSAMEQSFVKKPAGLIVVGFDPVLNPSVEKAINAGIPVVTVDADLPTSKRVAFVGTGNKNAGMMGAAKLVELIGEKGKIAISMNPGQSNLEDRVAGYKEYLAKYPGIEIVQIIDDKNDPVKAAEGTAAVLTKYQDLAAIVCVDGAGGAGAATAVKEQNKAGKVKIVAMDRGNDVCQLIKDGVISASVAQQTALMPFYALQICYNLKHNQLPISADNAKAGITGIPNYIDTGAVIVDANNVDQFIRK